VNQDLLVVTSCTARKLDPPGSVAHEAETLYTGEQHLRLMRGVHTYRRALQPAGPLRLRILSAFYGILKPTTRIASYDHTFAGKPTSEIRREARAKNVPSSIRHLLQKPFAAGLLLLGESYLHACDLDEHIKLGGPLISICSPSVARRMPRIAGLRIVPVANAEAHRFSAGLIALKGELGGRMLARLAKEPAELTHLTDPASDILGWLDGSWTEGSDHRELRAT